MKENKKHFLVAGIAALLMASALGLNVNTLGVYLQPIADSLNVNTGAISMHSTLISLGIAFGAFFVPPILKRFKMRVVVLVSTLVIAAATFGMAFSTAVWMFNVLGFIRGFAAAFFGIVALQLLINNWFIANHGLITSLVFSFSGVAGAVFSPILSSLIQNYGWQTTLMVHAGLFLLLNLPGIVIPYEFSPEEEGRTPFGSNKVETSTNKKEIVLISRNNYSFLSVTFGLTLAFSLLVSSLTALSQHLSGLAVDFGFTATLGALMISASMIGNIVFKLVIGILSDAVGTIVSIVLMIATVGVGLTLILLGSNDLTMLLGSLLFGAIYSVSAVGLSLFVAYIYSPMEFPRVFPMVNFISNAGSALAVSLYGYSFDLSGDYTLAVVISLVLALIIIGIALLANKTSVAKA